MMLNTMVKSMSDIDTRMITLHERMSVIETEVRAFKNQVECLDDSINKLTSCVEPIADWMQNTKGAWGILKILGGILLVGIGAIIGKIVDTLW